MVFCGKELTQLFEGLHYDDDVYSSSRNKSADGGVLDPAQEVVIKALYKTMDR